MKYSEYGLDNEKKAKDDETKAGHLFCPFCNTNNLSKGFSMCFSNWAICNSCLSTSTNIENNGKWVDLTNDYCFKCHQKNVIAFESDSATKIHICKNCIDWGKQILNKQTNTQLF